MSNTTKELSNPYVDLKLEDGIVFAKYKSDIKIDLEAAKILVEDRKKISDYQNYPLFIDATEVSKMSKEARNYFGTKEGAEFISAAAIYTNSSLSKFLANFLIRVNLIKQHTVVKAFDNKEKAIEWLKTFR